MRVIASRLGIGRQSMTSADEGELDHNLAGLGEFLFLPHGMRDKDVVESFVRVGFPQDGQKRRKAGPGADHHQMFAGFECVRHPRSRATGAAFAQKVGQYSRSGIYDIRPTLLRP